MLNVVLPYPPSTNQLWKPTWVTIAGRRVPTMVLTPEGKKYKTDCGWLVKRAGIRKPMAGFIDLTARLYPTRPQDWQARMRKLGAYWDADVQCLDVDNAIKIPIDALKNVAFMDDRMVWKITIERCEPDAQGARLEIDIAPHARTTPQPDMFGRAELDADLLVR
jgi:crossover junction endodeoxyribonuclease RusA